MKVETPVYKTEVVKVSNMEPVEILNDDSTFLVIHDGFAHKISTKALKENLAMYTKSLIEDFTRDAIQKRRQQEKNFSELSVACIDSVETLDKSITRKFQSKSRETKQYLDEQVQNITNDIVQWKTDALSTVVESISVVKSMFDDCQNTTAKIIDNQNLALSAENQQLKADIVSAVEKKYNNLLADVDAKNKTTSAEILNSIDTKFNQYQLSQKQVEKILVDSLQTLSSSYNENRRDIDRLSACSQSLLDNINKLQSCIDKNTDNLNETAQKLTMLSKTINELSSYASNIETTITTLSALETQLDQHLYGLVVEEIDENLVVTPHQLLSGDIIELSAQIQNIQMQHNDMQSVLTSLNEKLSNNVL